MSRRSLQIGGVIASFAAGGCFQLMETVPDYSPPSTTYFYGGYALVGVALVLFYLVWRKNS